LDVTGRSRTGELSVAVRTSESEIAVTSVPTGITGTLNLTYVVLE
jgi:hypothetical protein